MSWNLFIDDERVPADVTWASARHEHLLRTEQWTIARNYDQVMQLVAARGMPSRISFDHDLGHNERTGYQIAQRLCDMDIDDEQKFPADFEFYAHSMNPIGKMNIMRYLTRYMEFARG